MAYVTKQEHKESLAELRAIQAREIAAYTDFTGERIEDIKKTFDSHTKEEMKRYDSIDKNIANINNTLVDLKKNDTAVFAKLEDISKNVSPIVKEHKRDIIYKEELEKRATHATKWANLWKGILVGAAGIISALIALAQLI